MQRQQQQQCYQQRRASEVELVPAQQSWAAAAVVAGGFDSIFSGIEFRSNCCIIKKTMREVHYIVKDDVLSDEYLSFKNRHDWRLLLCVFLHFHFDYFITPLFLLYAGFLSFPPSSNFMVQNYFVDLPFENFLGYVRTKEGVERVDL